MPPMMLYAASHPGGIWNHLREKPLGVPDCFHWVYSQGSPREFLVRLGKKTCSDTGQYNSSGLSLRLNTKQ